MVAFLSVIIVLIGIVNASQGITNANSKIVPINAVNQGTGKDLKVDESRGREPPAEYYRGTPADIRERDRERDRYGGGLNRPVDRYGSGTASNNFITSPGAHENRYPSAATPGVYGLNTNRDRIGGGNQYGYGNTGTSNVGGYPYPGTTGLGSGHSVYDSSGTRGPYGPPQVIDYGQYGYGTSGYDIHDGSLDYGHNGYGFFGQPSHPFGGGGSKLTKSVLLPLAGAALLGVAAALVANPVLLQLGVVSGKRKKRSIQDDNLSNDLAYKGHIRRR